MVFYDFSFHIKSGVLLFFFFFAQTLSVPTAFCVQLLFFLHARVEMDRVAVVDTLSSRFLVDLLSNSSAHVPEGLDGGVPPTQKKKKK